VTRIINLFGGPGTGKSTTAAAIFSELKYRNINCEMALEYAKDRVWEGSEVVLDNQIYIFGKQHHRIWRLLDKVDYIITDSPLLNSILYYQGGNEFFPRCVFEEHQKLENTNIFLVREKPYNPAGRVQTEEKARLLDQRIVGILEYLGQDFHTVTADRYAASNIVDFYLNCGDSPKD